jgi:hypothetical protein
MNFARVQGFAFPDAESTEFFWLHVTLEQRSVTTVVRRERVARLSRSGSEDDLTWEADQYTQETLGTILALEGWEVVGEGQSSDEPTFGATVARSATYLVRRF